jgi:hypothetical protein
MTAEQGDSHVSIEGDKNARGRLVIRVISAKQRPRR